MISVIIRTKNEERWIKSCLEGILSQKVNHSVEIVLVDNESTDKTVQRAKAICPDLILVSIEHFLPGFALNEGIRVSNGEHIVCLSAHCPPVDNQWLAALLQNFDDPAVAGVYGRQVPTRFTNSVDKRDLMLTFGLERRVQERETFFHNANSMLRRDIWDRFPFDEKISNIEDRIWGQEVVRAGYKLVYEPTAAVFHHHGIHQDNRSDRARNVVQILESNIPDFNPEHLCSPFDPVNQEIVAIIPLRGNKNSIDLDQKLIKRTIQSAKESKLISRLVVATDSETISKMVSPMGAEVPFLRPNELSGNMIRSDEVLSQFLVMLEDNGYYPDVVVPLEITYPFRPEGLIDGVVSQLIQDGYDTVISAMPEYRACWQEKGGDMVQIALTDQPRQERKPLYVGLPSLACATYPYVLREGTRYGQNIGIFEVDDPVAGVEVRDIKELQRINQLFTL